jgi:hypothetical protein
MRSSVLVGYIMVAFGSLVPGTANATCGEECDSQYSSDIDDCRSQYGDNPADADDLASCNQEARDDYRSCLDDCASAAISPSRWRRLVICARIPEDSRTISLKNVVVPSGHDPSGGRAGCADTPRPPFRLVDADV